jgi:hypothetical protein
VCGLLSFIVIIILFFIFFFTNICITVVVIVCFYFVHRWRSRRWYRCRRIVVETWYDRPQGERWRTQFIGPSFTEAPPQCQ